MNAIQSQSTSNANSIAQWAAVTAITDSYAFIEASRASFAAAATASYRA